MSLSEIGTVHSLFPTFKGDRNRYRSARAIPSAGLPARATSIPSCKRDSNAWISCRHRRAKFCARQEYAPDRTDSHGKDIAATSR